MRQSGFKKSNLNRLGGLLNTQLKDLGLKQKVMEHQAIVFWYDIVGPQIADKTYPQSVKDGVIFVCCKNSMWANELSFHKADIIKRLNKSVGGKVISDLRFSARGFKIEDKNNIQESSKVKDKELAKVDIGEEKKDIVEKAAAVTSSGELKEKIKKAMLTGIRMAELKKQELEKKKDE